MGDSSRGQGNALVVIPLYYLIMSAVDRLRRREGCPLVAGNTAGGRVTANMGASGLHGRVRHHHKVDGASPSSRPGDPRDST